MKSRDRVLTALSHQEPDRVPIDLGGSAVSSIGIPAYAALHDYLGLPKTSSRGPTRPTSWRRSRRRRSAAAILSTACECERSCQRAKAAEHVANLPKTDKRSRTKLPVRALLDPQVDFLKEDFTGFSEAKVPFRRLHCHDDIEVSVNEHHPVAALFGGERIILPPGHLVVFWAARPHGPIETTPGGWAHSIHLPLPWVLQWQLPRELVHRLLAGQVVLDPPGECPTIYLDLIKNWVQLIEQGSAEARRIVLLEVEARLRRLALDWAVATASKEPCESPVSGSLGSLGRFEQMATLVAKHFREPLSVKDIAEAVRMKPAPAMRQFRKLSGMTLHEYLLRFRVSHAQRLLATTNAKILVIAEQSGFGSPAPFYAAFRRVVGQSPAAYRRSFREGC